MDGEDIARYSPRQLTAYRRNDIGFVFQFYNLVPNLTGAGECGTALQICKDPMDAETVMKEVGLGDRMKNFPAQLSGESSRGYPSQGLLRRIPSCCCVTSLLVRWIIIPERRF